MALLTCGVTFSATAAAYIREVMLVGGTKSEVDSLKSAYTARGWTVVGRDLNAGCGSGSDYIYLLYKAEECVDGVNPGYITGFHISNAGGDAPDRITRDGRGYYLVPYEGGNHFVGHRGDLNSNAGGDDIHLYYTTDTFPGNYAVTDIVFNDTRSGAVGVNGGSEGYDLNSGCGSGTAYIYMHVTTAIIAGNGSGASASVAIDLTPGARKPAATELIRYATEWVEEAGVGAVAVVEVNGETLHTAPDAGEVSWSPQGSGLYTLTHRVMSGDVQVGETLTALFYIGESESDIPTLGSGESASVAIDLTPGTRRAAASELFRYATEWVEEAGAGTVAVVDVNGETLRTASGAGGVSWSPREFGTYTLTHRVMSGDVQVGETLTAQFTFGESGSDDPVVPSIGIGSCESASVVIDLTPGVRTPAATELIRYATEWVEGAGADAVAVVEVNGETLHTASGAGVVSWSPQGSGLYILTHRVMFGTDQVGETLTALFYIGESESDIPTLGSGESAFVAIDLTPGTRRAAATELIRYATEWVDGAGAGAVAVVEVNGETLYTASGAGVVSWSPQKFGTYTLTHRVMSGADQVGETLTAIFILENPYSATQTTAVPVPYVWLRAYYPAIEDAYEAYETAAKAPAANPRFTVEEAYVAGFDPTDPLAAFRAYIAVANDDVRVWWWPNLNTNGVNRVYKVWGKTNLTDTSDWMYPTNSSHRFFKVTVEMP